MTPDQAREILLRGGADRAVAGRIAARVAAVATHLEGTRGEPVGGDLFWAIAATAADAAWRSDGRAGAAAARAAGRGKSLVG